MPLPSRRKKKIVRRSPRRPLRTESLESRIVLTSGDVVPSVDFVVGNRWDDGFQASLTIVNNDAVVLDDWSLTFTFEHPIVQVWNGQVTQDGHVVQIENVGWNATLQPGQQIEIGFLSSEAFESAPVNFVFHTLGETPANVIPPVTDPTVSDPTADDASSQTPEPPPPPVPDPVVVQPPDVTPNTSSPVAPTELTGDYNYAEVLQKSLYFYDAQRSGDLPDDFRVDWRGDSGLTDGADVGVDLTGGFYDAGDHVKFGFPMASTMTMLAWGLVEYPEAYAQSGQLAAMQDTLRWGADYIMRAHTAPNELWGQVGDGGLDHSFWAAPEVMTMDRPAMKIDASQPGSDLASESAASLAATAMTFQESDPDYAAELLQHARELYSFADDYRGAYSESIVDAAQFYRSWSGYEDELVWGAIWLYRATGETAYLEKAERYYADHLAGDKFEWTQNWDDKRYGAAVALADLTDKSIYKRQVEDWLDYWTVGNRAGERISYTPGGLAHLDRWGSLRYAANTAFLAYVYADNVNDIGQRYSSFATDQINYMLGDNPNGRSYVVGFGINPPVNPHHRGASGVHNNNVNAPGDNRNVLYGALVGGPDSPDDDSYRDERDRYVDNEVALDYNAGFQGAVARLYLEFGGEPLDDAIAFPQTASAEMFVEASVNNAGTRFTEIRGLLNNQTHQPARASEQLSFRYFVDLSEVFEAGYSVADTFVVANFTQGADVSDLQAWNAEEHVYFVIVDYTGTRLAPGCHTTFRKEAQIRIGVGNHVPATVWDPANDWSYHELRSGFNGQEISSRIPVYDAHELVFGAEPDGRSSNGTFMPPSDPLPEDVSSDPGNEDRPDDGNNGEPIQPELTPPTQPSSQTPTDTLTAVPTDTPSDTPTAIPVVRESDVELRIESEWGTGFVGYLSIFNSGVTPLEDWVVEFSLDAKITNLWNGQLVEQSGNRYTVNAATWNQLVGPNQEVAFGFQAEGSVGNGISDVLLNGLPLVGNAVHISSIDVVLDDELAFLPNRSSRHTRKMDRFA